MLQQDWSPVPHSPSLPGQGPCWAQYTHGPLVWPGFVPASCPGRYPVNGARALPICPAAGWDMGQVVAARSWPDRHLPMGRLHSSQCPRCCRPFWHHETVLTAVVSYVTPRNCFLCYRMPACWLGTDLNLSKVSQQQPACYLVSCPDLGVSLPLW